MQGLVRRFAMAAGAIALAVSSAAGVAITTAAPAQAAGRQVTLPFGPDDLVDPAGLAVDAAGDVFGVSGGLEGPMIVRELQRNPDGTVQEVTLPFSGLNDPQAVAVDGLGDVFVADMLNNRIVELPRGPNGWGSQVTLPFTGVVNPWGVTVDLSRDVFVTDETTNGRVLELPRAVTPFHVPGRPGITSVTPGDGQATVAFTPSQADLNRGNPLTYTVIARAGNNVTSGPGITASGTTSPITVTGLVTGTNYTITVYATNGVAGNGPESAFVLLYRLPGQRKSPGRPRVTARPPWRSRRRSPT